MSWGPLSAIVEAISNLGGKYLKRKIVQAEGKIRIAEAYATAEAEVQLKKVTAELDWEKSMADSTRTSWKDEYWTVVLSIPFMGAFIPPVVPYIAAGFEVLSKVPEWYGIALGLAISAAFGKNIIKYFTDMKGMK